MSHSVPSILFVIAAAALASMLAEATRRLGVSVVVIEILLGVAIGPQGLAWADVSQGATPYLATSGMVFLFFMAGIEIDLATIRSEFSLAVRAWGSALAVGIVIALAMSAAGLVDAWLVVAIALTTTALGVLVPILKDAAALESPFGRKVMGLGVLGELGPIIAMSVVLTTRHSTSVQIIFTIGFLVIIALVYWVSTHVVNPGVMAILRSTLLRSGQLPVRIAVLLMIAMVVLAEELGIDLALGALAAGMIVGLPLRKAVDHTMHHKLEAISFGFLVPVFFVSSGMKLDVASIFSTRDGMLLLAVTFIALVLVRIPAIFLYGRTIGKRQAVAHGFLSATTLSLIVAITQIAVAGGTMKPSEAAPLVGAGMLTVLVFPTVGLAIARLTKGQDSEAIRLGTDGL